MEIIVACCLFMLFCASCSLIGNVDIVTLPDPFAQPPRGAVVQHGEPIVLEAIVDIDGKFGVALSCNQEHEMLTTGDTFRGFTVARISSNRVELVKGRNKRILRVNE